MSSGNNRPVIIRTDGDLAGMMPFATTTWSGAVSRAQRCADREGFRTAVYSTGETIFAFGVGRSDLVAVDTVAAILEPAVLRHVTGRELAEVDTGAERWVSSRNAPKMMFTYCGHRNGFDLIPHHGRRRGVSFGVFGYGPPAVMS